MKLAMLPTGQLALPWFIDHRAAIVRTREMAAAKRREEVAKLRRERGGIRHLLMLADLPESHLTKDELSRLDDYVTKARDSIKAAWTAEQEAEARGVKMRKSDRWVEYDGRLFQRSVGMMPIGRDEWGDIGGDECE